MKQPVAGVATERADGYVLCQDCGHVEPWTADRHQEREACRVCSGQFCGCDTCNELARLAVQFQTPAGEGGAVMLAEFRYFVLVGFLVALPFLATIEVLEVIELYGPQASSTQSQVKDTPASRTRSAKSVATEHRTGEDVAQRILDPPGPTSLRAGAGEGLHLPSSRALGGKSGMTRATPLVL